MSRTKPVRPEAVEPELGTESAAGGGPVDDLPAEQVDALEHALQEQPPAPVAVLQQGLLVALAERGRGIWVPPEVPVEELALQQVEHRRPLLERFLSTC